jgi:hypothetical protein
VNRWIKTAALTSNAAVDFSHAEAYSLDVDSRRTDALPLPKERLMTDDPLFYVDPWRYRDPPYHSRAKRPEAVTSGTEAVTSGKTYADIPVLAPEVTDEEFAEILRECRALSGGWEPPEC